MVHELPPSPEISTLPESPLAKTQSWTKLRTGLEADVRSMGLTRVRLCEAMPLP